MKRVGWVFLVFLSFLAFLAGCGLVPISKESLKEGEVLTVAIEGYFFYENLIMKDLGGGKASFSIDLSSPLRNDEVSNRVMETLAEKFPEALRERRVVVASGSPMKIRINIAQKTTPNLVHFMGVVNVIKDGTTVPIPMASVLTGYADPLGALFAPNSERNVTTAKHMARRFNDLLANAVINNYHGIIK